MVAIADVLETGLHGPGYTAFNVYRKIDKVFIPKPTIEAHMINEQLIKRKTLPKSQIQPTVKDYNDDDVAQDKLHEMFSSKALETLERAVDTNQLIVVDEPHLEINMYAAKVSEASTSEICDKYYAVPPEVQQHVIGLLTNIKNLKRLSVDDKIKLIKLSKLLDNNLIDEDILPRDVYVAVINVNCSGSKKSFLNKVLTAPDSEANAIIDHVWQGDSKSKSIKREWLREARIITS